MNLFPFFNEDGFSNSYILAPKESHCPCIIIDPSDFTIEMLNIVENHNYIVEGIFLTHYNRIHTSGLTKLTKIYNPKIYAPRTNSVGCFKIEEIGNRTEIQCGDISVKMIHILVDFGRAIFYNVDDFIFTGDLYQAGDWYDEEFFSINHAFIIKNFKNFLQTDQRNFKIYPGHGAPSSCHLEFPESITHEEDI